MGPLCVTASESELWSCCEDVFSDGSGWCLSASLKVLEPLWRELEGRKRQAITSSPKWRARTQIYLSNLGFDCSEVFTSELYAKMFQGFCTVTVFRTQLLPDILQDDFSRIGG